MTFTQQVRHFLAFDLRRTYAWWVVYLLLVLITPLFLFGGPLYDRLLGAGVLLPALSWLVAMGLAVTVVQGDAPLSVTAFWRGKPIDGRALGASKILVLALVVASASLVSVAIWRWLDMPLPTVVAFMQQGAPALLKLLLLAAMFGAVTRSFNAAFLAMVGLVTALTVLAPAAFLLWMTSAPLFRQGIDLALWRGIGILIIVTIAVGLMLSYRAHRTRPRQLWLAVIAAIYGSLAVAGQLVELLGVQQRDTVRYSNPLAMQIVADAPSSMKEVVQFDSVVRLQRVGGSLAFTIRDVRTDRRYELQTLALTPVDVRGTIGPRLAMQHTRLATPESVIPLSVGWQLKRSVDSRAVQADRGLMYGDLRVSERLDTIRTVAVSGVLVRHRLAFVKRMPVALGTLHSDDLGAMALDQAPNGEVALRWISFGNSGGMEGISSGEPPLFQRYAIVLEDSASRVLRPLAASGTNMLTEWLVLPGAVRRVSNHELNDQAALRAVLQAPRASASIAVYRWVEDGRRRMLDTLRVEDWPRRGIGVSTRATAVIGQ